MCPCDYDLGLQARDMGKLKEFEMDTDRVLMHAIAQVSTLLIPKWMFGALVVTACVTFL